MKTQASKHISILHVVISLETGGLERFVIDLINYTNNDFRHKIVCLERTGELVQPNREIDIACLNMKSGLHLKIILDICSIIRNNEIDIIHTHNEKAQFYGALAGFFCRIPVVHTKHGKNHITIKPRIRNHLLARFCTRVVAVSHDAAVQCTREEKISASKVLTILNGVDTKIFSPSRDTAAIKTSLGIDCVMPVIGIVARLSKVKDHATLFEACVILKKSYLDFRLLVVGDGPLMGDLVARADSLDLHNHIIFTGIRHDIPALMNAMDIFVLSSTSEGISLTLIEAMATELPIVATNVGGNPEVVIHGETGFLVPSQDPMSMAEQIQQLLNNIILRKEFGRKGRLRAIEHFSIQRAAQQYERLYHDVLMR